MLDQVYFPTVTLCNINQGRRSFFLEQGLHTDRRLLRAVLAQVCADVPRQIINKTSFYSQSAADTLAPDSYPIHPYFLGKVGLTLL